MRRKNFENIGKVAVNEISLCDSEIGLYIPIEKMSENIRRESTRRAKSNSRKQSKKSIQKLTCHSTRFTEM